MELQLRPLDRNALRFNQAAIIACLALGFVLNQPWLVAFVAAVMAIGTIWPGAGLFKSVYLSVLRPRGWVKPDVVEDTANAHLFAQGVGALFLIASSVALFTGVTTLGWALAWIVIILAAVNLFFGFCVGCFVYYQLARLGVHIALPTWS